MKKHFYSIFVWFVLAFVFYFAADIVEKGRALNRLTPFPVFGLVFWGLILALIWVLLVKPILDFCRLSRRSQCSEEDRAAALLARLDIQIKANKGCDDFWNEKEWNAYAELKNVIREKKWDSLNAVYSQDSEKNDKTLIEVLQSLDLVCTQGRELVLSYCKTAAIAVAFNRNAFLDGICMLVIQMKLVVALARLYGYKPSPVFNACCFVWIVTNSIVATLLNSIASNLANEALEKVGESVAETGGDASESFGEMLGDAAAGDSEDGILTGALALGQQVSSFVIGILFEAIASGAAVYVTGRIFLSKLNGEWDKPTFGTLIKLRREGRKAIAKSIPDFMSSLSKKILHL